MIELDGVEYALNTPEENCNEALRFINDYCAERGVTNSRGEVIYIEPNTTNPLYMILYGLSYLVTVLQKLIYSVGASFSIPHSSDTQLLNLADIANVRRRPATKTIIHAEATSNLPGEEAVDCVITPSLSVTLPTEDGNVIFHPATDYIIHPGEGANITLIAEQEGSYHISAGAFTSFDTPVDGLRSLTAEASEPGKDEETIAELRSRIQRREVEETPIDRTTGAIKQLPGVNDCNIYFNYSSYEDANVGKGDHIMTVGPRKALVLVSGYSPDIAKTFYSYLICESQQVPSSEVQYYITRVAQELPVYITPPTPTPVYVRLLIEQNLGYEKELQIKDAILGLESKITIGQDITAVFITEQLKDLFPTMPLFGVEVGLGDSAFSYSARIEQNEIARFNTDNIIMRAVGV